MGYFKPIVILVSAAILLGGCSDVENGDGSVNAHDNNSRLVLTSVVQPYSPDSETIVGLVSSRIISDLGFPLTGRLISRRVEVGDHVAANEQLAVIETTGLKEAVDAARAAFRSAQAQLDNASGAFQRQSQLKESGATSQAALEAAELQLNTARSRVASAKASLAQADHQLANTLLSAPFEGVVTGVSGSVGQIISAGSAVVTLARPELRDAVLDVSESARRFFKKGDVVEVVLELDPTTKVSGKVRDIEPEADPATRLYRINVSLDNAPASFRFGTTVLLRSESPARGDYVSLPATAVFDSNGQKAVWVVDPEKHIVSIRAVSVQEIEGNRATISTGPQPGERVVIAGVHSLNEGQPVRIDGDFNK